MSYSTQGASNRQIYDCCDYAQELQQSVDPLQYYLYFGAQENCSKCIDKKAWYRQDTEIVNLESELWNITRPLSRCDQFKYNPNCTTSPECTSTFDPQAPKILSPSLCPIVYNNIPIQTSPGYNVPDTNICAGKNEFREADSINTYNSYTKQNAAILGNSNEPQNAYMFLNSCSNTPLYQGAVGQLRPLMADTTVNPENNQGIPFAWQMHSQMSSNSVPTGISAPISGAVKNSSNSNVVSSSNMYQFTAENESVHNLESEYQYI